MRVNPRKKPVGRQGKRPGSVMIMVVTLLVLLALMGTAYVSMVRSDRGSSVQHVENTQVDMLIQGAVSVLQGTLAGDLFDPDTNGYRDAAGPLTGRYDDYDSPVPGNQVDPDAPAGAAWIKLRNDNFLADRVPQLDTTGPQQAYYWRWISGPLKAAAFEDPLTGRPYHWINNTTPTMHRGEEDWGHSSNTFPGVYPGALTQNGVTYPAFIRFGDDNKDRQPDYDVIAADTDGDGIADAGLSRLVDGPVNGLVWYVAHRTIDNNSAINASIAWEDYTIVRATDRYASTATVGDPNETSNPFTAGLPLRGLSRLFPTNIDLVSLLMTPSPPPPFNPQIPPYSVNYDLGRLNRYRAWPNGFINGDDSPGRPTGQPQLNGSYNAPMDDFGRYAGDSGGSNPPAPDFTYLDRYDALWTQLGRRPGRPGSNYSTSVPFTRLPVGDALNLASGYVVDNGVPYTVRTELFDTLTLRNTGAVLPVRPYLPGESFLWGAVNFFEPGTNANDSRLGGATVGINLYNRKPLLTTYNPVSTSVPVHYWHVDTNGNGQSDDVPHPDMLEYFPNFRGNWASGAQPAYRAGDLVLYPATLTQGVQPAVYRCLRANSTSAPLTGSPPNVSIHEDWEYQPNIPRPMKANLNTAGFSELFRAYWNVMVQYDPSPPGTGRVPVVTARVPNPTSGTKAPMFERSSLRATRTSVGAVNPGFNDEQMALLRAAIAAVNTLDLRDSDDDITSVDLSIGGSNVTVFGQEKQPFITEVYATSNTVADPLNRGWVNPRGYVAVELHNPYDTPIDISGWVFKIVDRSPPTPSPSPIALQFETQEYVVPAGRTIPANGYMVLENFDQASTTRPPPPSEKEQAAHRGRADRTFMTTGNPTPWSSMYWPALWRVMRDDFNSDTTLRSRGGELILLRPRRTDNVRVAQNQHKSYNSPSPTDVGYNETSDYELVPVDQFDFTGMSFANPAAVPPASNQPERVYYRRPNSGAGAWKFVYPGNYSPTLLGDRYQSDARYESIDPNLVLPNPIDPTMPIATGETDLPMNPGFNGSDTDGTVRHPHPPIQLARFGWGPYKYPPTGATFLERNKYPFGGFARLGDVLQVPFIGAYRVTTNAMDSGRIATAFAEFNSVTMDAAMAEDNDTNNDAYEHVGRFAPINYRESSGETAPSGSRENYDWAKDIFDYFTVFSPHDDYFPNADPKVAPNTSGGTGAETPYQSTNGPSGGGPRNPPRPVYTSSSGSFDQTGDANDGIEGLININTASWRVLAAVPFTPDPLLNRDIARSIVDHRNTQGPFESLHDLNNVFVNISTPPVGPCVFHEVWLRERNPQTGSPMHTYNSTTFDEPTGFAGDFSPENASTPQNQRPNYDGVRGDFEERNLMLTRVSNLLTTRSDTFISYITIQGWRDVGSPTAKMEVQRRYVLMLDRTGVSPANREVKTLLIPLE